MLLIFSGLPGAGKTTLAKAVSAQLAAVYLRIDTVEQVLKRECGLQGPEGYKVCYEVAKDNLHLGNTVVADSVNPIAITRRDWRQVAADIPTQAIQIEVLCSDTRTHRHRVETRQSDIVGHTLPSWTDVLQRDYEPWEEDVLRIDTAMLSPQEACVRILAHAKKAR
jgi:predicted kinase